MTSSSSKIRIQSIRMWWWRCPPPRLAGVVAWPVRQGDGLHACRSSVSWLSLCLHHGLLCCRAGRAGRHCYHDYHDHHQQQQQEGVQVRVSAAAGVGLSGGTGLLLLILPAMVKRPVLWFEHGLTHCLLTVSCGCLALQEEVPLVKPTCCFNTRCEGGDVLRSGGGTSGGGTSGGGYGASSGRPLLSASRCTYS